MTLKKKIITKELKFVFLIPSIIIYSMSLTFGYELNKNIIYYQGFIDGYLFKENENWSIICEPDNNERCLLTQFLEASIVDERHTFLIFVIKENNENILGVRTKPMAQSGSSNGVQSKVMVLSNEYNLKFQLLNTKCNQDFCEYIAVIPDKFMKKLESEDNFIIGFNSEIKNGNLGIIVEMKGFVEMFDVLSEN